jgi:hypothetical protein
MTALLAALLCALAAQSVGSDAPPAPPPLSPLLWRYDLDAAGEEARAAGKDLFVNFTGSDWCGWCHKLDAEVFSQPGFKQALSEEYLLVSLDFPRSQAAQALVPDAKRNRELARQHEVSAYPTILLMTADGDVYGRTGYREGGAEDYLEHLRALRAEGRPPLIAARELSDAYEAAPEEARPALVERSVALLEGARPGSAAARHLALVAAHALESAAADRAEGRERALRALLACDHASEAQLELARELDPRNAKGLLELAVHTELLRVKDESGVRRLLSRIDELDSFGPIRDRRAAKDLYASAAQWKRSFGRDPAASRKFAAKALPYATEDEALKKQLEGLLRG